MALAGVLRPDLATVAVLLPELLAGLLLLSHTFLLVDSFVFAFLTENFLLQFNNALVAEFISL